MKAFLLAAGLGTRLRPLTDKVPKCLVPIRGVPMLEIWMEICGRAGIDEVTINLHCHGDAVRAWLENHYPQGNDHGDDCRHDRPNDRRNGCRDDWRNGRPDDRADDRPDGRLDDCWNAPRVRLVEEPTLLGSAGTVLANRDWIGSDRCFWIFYADVLTDASLGKMMALHRLWRPTATLGLYQVPDPSRCGVVSFDEQMIVRQFVEKPARPLSQWAFSGIMIGTQQLLDEIPARYPVDFGFDVLPRLAGKMLAYPISEYLIDVGTMENYRAAEIDWPGLARERVEENIAR